jgi:all-trans-retinol 13,14-reductase
VEAGREARRLVLEGNRVVGVEHFGRDGNTGIDLAPAVFGNAAPNRLAEMLPADKRERFRARYARRRPSIALWTISLGLNRPAQSFGVHHYSTSVLPAWMARLADIKQSAAIMAEPEGDRLPPYLLVDYGRIDSGLNEAGLRLASLCGVDRVENWSGLTQQEKRTQKEQWMDRLIADLDRQFPGIAAAIVHREMATAETMQHYLNTPGGAVYGFAPEGSGPIHIAPGTAIDGLWLASAYTFAGGYTGATVGGAMAARAAMTAANVRAKAPHAS